MSDDSVAYNGGKPLDRFTHPYPEGVVGTYEGVIDGNIALKQADTLVSVLINDATPHTSEVLTQNQVNELTCGELRNHQRSCVRKSIFKAKAVSLTEKLTRNIDLKRSIEQKTKRQLSRNFDIRLFRDANLETKALKTAKQSLAYVAKSPARSAVFGPCAPLLEEMAEVYDLYLEEWLTTEGGLSDLSVDISFAEMMEAKASMMVEKAKPLKQTKPMVYDEIYMVAKLLKELVDALTVLRTELPDSE